MKRTRERLLRLGVLALIFGMLTVQSTWARWMHGTSMPISRLLKNMGDYVKMHPKDPLGYYTLGRINSAGFAQDTENVIFYTHGELPAFPDHAGLAPPSRDRTKPLTPHSLTYLFDAVSNYKQATEIAPSDGLAWLGLAFQCEEALPYPQAIDRASDALARPEKLGAESLRHEALRLYRKAYMLTIKTDTIKPLGLSYPVSMEAAQGIVRLQKKSILSAVEQSEITTLKQKIAAFRKRPRMITPILISFQRRTTLPDLLAPRSRVRFDLAGDGMGGRWPWIKPTTGILVWDPGHTGKITSGLQLFGSVTWWLFWKDGYEPLAALDNDHNGRLEGAELQGIAVWFDLNGNGIADPGEVVSLPSLGITSIAVHSAGLTEGVSANAEGVHLRDGSYLPTFDWTPTSLPNTKTTASHGKDLF